MLTKVKVKYFYIFYKFVQKTGSDGSTLAYFLRRLMKTISTQDPLVGRTYTLEELLW